MSQSVETRLSGLRHLPELVPAAELEAKTLAAMAAAGEERHGIHLGRAAAWAAVTVTGLLLAALALDSGGSGDRRSAGAVDASGSVAPAAADASPITIEESDLLALLEQSNYLERVLAALPQRQVMRVGTAGTIAGLEQQIAQIDQALWTTDGPAVSPEYRYTLLRDRVDTMNALVNVRYSQSRAFSY